MTLVLDGIAWLVALALLVPLGVLAAECLAALLPSRRPAGNLSAVRPRCAVLVPAHNEEAGIGTTLTAIQAQLQPGDRLLVVADNCQDQTAEVARSFGATVVERNDPSRRGKGFALDFGVRFLETDPPEVVLIVDADCRVHEGAIDRLVRATAATGRPVQAAYLLDGPTEAASTAQLSAFAFLLKNFVRPLGLDRVGLPCLLTGTGMAFPWPVLREAALASGNIVEDMQMGIDLALAGHPAKFCPEARVSGELPSSRRAAVTQRTRWEHGHLQTLLTQAPRLVWSAIRQRRLTLLGLALELSVPPLALLGLLWATALTGLAAWTFLGGSPVPAILLAGSSFLVLVLIGAVWFQFGREQLPFVSLLMAPFYILAKVPIYLAFIFRRQRAWVRTERSSPGAADNSVGKEAQANPVKSSG